MSNQYGYPDLSKPMQPKRYVCATCAGKFPCSDPSHRDAREARSEKR